MFNRLSSAFKMQVLNRHLGSGDYENAEEVVAVRASEEATTQAEQLLDTTLDLVESGADQPDTISAMRAMDPSQEIADLALGLLRVEYFPFELRNANAAWRYLVAVKHGEDVIPLGAEEAEQIERMEAFARFDPASAYGQLAALEPKLGEAEEFVRQHSSDWDGTSADRDGFLRIDQMLAPLVGPGSNPGDSLLHSRYARHIARTHLIRAGKLLED
jgi:hypothetical protein